MGDAYSTDSVGNAYPTWQHQEGMNRGYLGDKYEKMDWASFVGAGGGGSC